MLKLVSQQYHDVHRSLGLTRLNPVYLMETQQAFFQHLSSICLNLASFLNWLESVAFPWACGCIRPRVISRCAWVYASEAFLKESWEIKLAPLLWKLGDKTRPSLEKSWEIKLRPLSRKAGRLNLALSQGKLGDWTSRPHPTINRIHLCCKEMTHCKWLCERGKPIKDGLS